jgi:DNA topoisomerase I
MTDDRNDMMSGGRERDRSDQVLSVGVPSSVREEGLLNHHRYSLDGSNQRDNGILTSATTILPSSYTKLVEPSRPIFEEKRFDAETKPSPTTISIPVISTTSHENNGFHEKTGETSNDVTTMKLGKFSHNEDEDDDEDDIPLSIRVQHLKGKIGTDNTATSTKSKTSFKQQKKLSPSRPSSFDSTTHHMKSASLHDNDRHSVPSSLPTTKKEQLSPVDRKKKVSPQTASSLHHKQGKGMGGNHYSTKATKMENEKSKPIKKKEKETTHRQPVNGEMDDDDLPLSLRIKKEFGESNVIKVEKKRPLDEVTGGSTDGGGLRTTTTAPRIKKIKREQKPRVSHGEDSDKARVHDRQSKDQMSKTKTTTTKTALPKVAKLEMKEEEEEAMMMAATESSFKWWEQQLDFDDSIKWNTLEHCGVYFPPDYISHHIKMLYDGREVELDEESEEMAGFYAQLLDTEWVGNPVFRKNFFTDFLRVLNRNCNDNTDRHVIRELEKCDFTPIQRYYLDLKEKKKNASKEEKEALKAEKSLIEARYGWAVVDGRREKVGNFRVEPPGLFRGRGQHPKAGCLKLRVQPEQVVINVGKTAQIPEAPAGHSWGGVVHDNTVAWLATWTENVQNSQKYVLFAASSTIKGQSDLKKFQKARDLKKHIERIRRDYMRDLRDEKMEIRQRATALYLIDRLALRAGNEKGEDEADTVGCCSLRVEHVRLEPPNLVIFDFLGKDSIRYYNEVAVDGRVFKNLQRFQKGIDKKPGDPLFDRLNTNMLNRHLNSLMSGLTAKVFRTHNASFVFQQELEKTPRGATIHERLLAYNRANRQVAVLCNHQRSIPKAHGQQMLRLKDKILAIKMERRELRLAILVEDPKRGSRNPALLDEESDLEEDTIPDRKSQSQSQRQQSETSPIVAEQGDGEQKFDNEEPHSQTSTMGKASTTPSSISPCSSPSKKKLSIERMEEKILKLDQRIIALKTMLIDKDENKTTALGTSKINYLDPRISTAWCYKHQVPIEKIFNKSLRDKFQWAMIVNADWKF